MPFISWPGFSQTPRSSNPIPPLFAVLCKGFGQTPNLHNPLPAPDRAHLGPSRRGLACVQQCRKEEEIAVRHCRNQAAAMILTEKAHTKFPTKPFDEFPTGLLRRPMKKFWQNAGQDINSMSYCSGVGP